MNFLPDRFFGRRLAQFPNFWPTVGEDEIFPLSEDFTSRAAKIYEEGNKLHVEVPLPGLDRSDIEVSLSKGVLIVKGKKEEKEEDKKRKIYRASKRDYFYSVTLPTQTDEKQEPQAVYENGMLNVSLTLPKSGETKKITVKSGSSKK